MPHLNAPAQLQHALTVGAGVAGFHVTKIHDLASVEGHVPIPVHALVMLVQGAGAADKVCEGRGAVVDEEGDGEAHGADKARYQTRTLKRVFPGEAEGVGDARKLRRLDRVQGVIAPKHKGHGALRTLNHEGLEALGSVHAELRGKGFDASSLWGVYGGEGGAGGRARRCRRQSRSQLDVRCVVRAVAEGDEVFPAFREHVELVGFRPADVSRVREDGAEVEAHALKDAVVGGVHLPVGDF